MRPTREDDDMFKKVREKAVRKIDRLSTCQGCGHSSESRSCACRRSDCACAFRR